MCGILYAKFIQCQAFFQAFFKLFSVNDDTPYPFDNTLISG
ncbi:hypothetical protein EJK55_0461 [Moraxella catarrhalis]|uniref:Uncharacterized protein n=1 Tax=Moraxella catarrhalis TaxID=480 RepID=A0A3Q9GEG3_MORCA|nr:hypothetical protein EJK52_0785 [Moraxella catarrhalis]AZQ89168.1 hypothetical protein EJK50_0781 [Moraxella catarrhalis]AZQ91632.1 hypothetical protein EJK51_0783 [Moraxella catarrhalis]AZQ93581.1 hypothetical protein EJK53_0791 [Moraxella catarrhalis]AZQ95723.1 hypothetical protein EJK48_0798 [Moraxella catarrhalis]